MTRETILCMWCGEELSASPTSRGWVHGVGDKTGICFDCVKALRCVVESMERKRLRVTYEREGTPGPGRLGPGEETAKGGGG